MGAAEKIVEVRRNASSSAGVRSEPVAVVRSLADYRGPAANAESDVARANRRDRAVVAAFAAVTLALWGALIYGMVAALQAPVFF